MRSNLIIRAALAAGLASMALGAAAEPASACDNGVQIVVDTMTPRIARAERALREGKHTLAAVGVLQVFPNIRQGQITEGPLKLRAMRLMALAAVRTDGALTAGKQWRGTTAEEQRANIEWAIATLRGLDKVRPNTPSIQTDLGEALAKDGRSSAEALTLLSKLADRDLITSAEGYAALSRLREIAGDTAGRDAAAKRCEAMAKTPGTCRAGRTSGAAA